MKRFTKGIAFAIVCTLGYCACTSNFGRQTNGRQIVVPDDSLEVFCGKRILCGDTLPGIVSIAAADKYIIAISDERTPLFTVLSKKGGRVVDFGYKGHAYTEFQTTAVLKQYTNDGCIVVNDVNSRK